MCAWCWALKHKTQQSEARSRTSNAQVDGQVAGCTPERILSCAKQCVAKGAKIVLIVPDQKRLLSITNQGTAKRNIGDYVKVIGMVDQQANSIHIDSLKY